MNQLNDEETKINILKRGKSNLQSHQGDLISKITQERQKQLHQIDDEMEQKIDEYRHQIEKKYAERKKKIQVEIYDKITKIKSAILVIIDSIKKSKNMIKSHNILELLHHPGYIKMF